MEKNTCYFERSHTEIEEEVEEEVVVEEVEIEQDRHDDNNKKTLFGSTK